MPYRARGNLVQVKRKGKWTKLSRERSSETAKRKAAKLNIEKNKR